MNCTELSLENLKNECEAWAREISKEFVPDLLIYVANAGYPIGKAMQNVFDAPMIGIIAQRKGNKLKAKVGKLFKHMPSFIRNTLIKAELKSGVHGKQIERNIKWLDETSPFTNVKKILVIDDSVDTGVTLDKVKEEVQKAFTDSDVRLAGLNVWDKSKDVVKTDFVLYENTIIKAPMSKDSKEYNAYQKMLDERTLTGKNE